MLSKVDLSHDETSDVMKHFDKRGRGYIEYKDFIDLVGLQGTRGRSGPDSGTPRGDRGGRPPGPHRADEEILDDVLVRLRKRISRDLKHGSDMEKVG